MLQKWGIILGTIVVAQGFLLTILLLRHQKRRSYNQFFSAFFFALSLLVLGDVMTLAGVRAHWHWVSWIFDWILLTLGPFLFLYAQSVIGGAGGPLKSRWLLHFLPAFVVLVWCVVQALRESSTGSLGHPFTGLNRGSPWQMGAIAAQIFLYLAASIWRLFNWRAGLKRSYSNIERRSLTWFMCLLLAGLIVLASWVYSLYLPFQSGTVITSAVCGVLVFVCGALGLDQVSPLKAESQNRTGNEIHALASIQTLVETEGPALPFADPSTTSKTVNEIAAILSERMQVEKFYLESDLSLGELASLLGTSTHLLSQTLNQELGLSFYDYINGLRVEEVKRCLKDSNFDQQTILEIALASGFASKSTFNAVFRKQAGMTPIEYRRSTHSTQTRDA
jgi:AraC-like DNA-binding protein